MLFMVNVDGEAAYTFSFLLHIGKYNAKKKQQQQNYLDYIYCI